MFVNSQELAEKLQKHDEEFLAFVKEHKAQLESEEKALRDEIGFEGEIFGMGQKGYHKRRNQYATTSHALMDISPRFILYPHTSNPDADIIRIVNYCRESGRKLAVRTGGHQYCAYSSTDPQNLQIDVSKCYLDYEYDEKENTLRCGVSWALGDWAAQNNRNGIFLPMGVCAQVHLGGHVQTGGWGMLGRSHGLLADYVLSIELIQADGTMRTVLRPQAGETDEGNDELYFAILGGGRGGDFGIVKAYTFQPLRDADYADSANFVYVWLRTPANTRKMMKLVQKYQDLCAKGEIPNGYDFMVTMTGAGLMNVIPDNIKEPVKAAIARIINDITNDALYLPPMMLIWLQYAGQSFDPKWFRAFVEKEEGVGRALHGVEFTRKEAPKNAPSFGLANCFIFRPDRELSYPFVKRARVSFHTDERFPDVFSDRVDIIGGLLGTRHGCHLFAQPQIYAGGMVSEKGKLGLTSYSWRDAAIFLASDCFYDVEKNGESARDFAMQWQAENDAAFLSANSFSDKDMRLFPFTFGDIRSLEQLWPFFYDSEEKYIRLRKIKARVDPTGVFVANPFSVKPFVAKDADDEKQ